MRTACGTLHSWRKDWAIAGIGVAEFGVAGGVTLMILARYATEIEKATGVRIKVYGFDTGGGLPELEGAEDLPYWFRPSQYSLDVERLRRRRLIPLSLAHLYVVGAPGQGRDIFILYLGQPEATG